MFLIIKSITLLPHFDNLAPEVIGPGDGVGCIALEALLPDVGLHGLVTLGRQKALAYGGAMQRNALSHPGIHADGVVALLLENVHRPVVLQYSDVHGLPSPVPEPARNRSGNLKQIHIGKGPGSYSEHLQCKTIAVRAVARDIAVFHERGKQPQGRGLGQTCLFGKGLEVRGSDFGEGLQQAEGSSDRTEFHADLSASWPPRLPCTWP